ncbi:MAG: hypothetical protein SWC96_12970 [Thermodesulfobacteriota bacterium]|nr:hypothetical protein [Thermodesulfobacteriota bacterium]
MEYAITIKIGRRLLLFLGGLVVVGVAGTVCLFLVFDPLHNIQLRVNLQQQQIKARMAASFPVTADIDQMLRVPLKADIPVSVPFSQDLSVPLHKTFDVPVEINTTIPVYMTVPFKSDIPIDTQVFLETEVRTSVLGVPLTVPIKGYVPVRATIPVDQTVTVKEDFQLALRTPVTVDIQDTFTIPITTRFTTTVPVETQLAIPFQDTIQANVALEGAVADQIPNLYILDNAIDIGLGRFRLVWKKDR